MQGGCKHEPDARFTAREALEFLADVLKGLSVPDDAKDEMQTQIANIARTLDELKVIVSP